MIWVVEAACIVYIAGCLLAVALDLWMHHSTETKGRRQA